MENHIYFDDRTREERIRQYYNARFKLMQDAFEDLLDYQQICHDLVDEGIITGIDLVQRKIKKEKERGR